MPITSEYNIEMCCITVGAVFFISVRKKVDDRRRPPTGGGRAAAEISTIEEALIALGPDDPSLFGLDRGVDSFVVNMGIYFLFFSLNCKNPKIQCNDNPCDGRN